MPRAEANGLSIEYEIVGDAGPGVVVTPGGRYSKNIEGLKELAEKLVRQGFRVLLWDRPNCGGSDLCFSGQSESIQNADTLAALLRQTDMAPAFLVGGSGAAREALLTALRHPGLVKGLFLFWISGGSIGLSTLAYAYYSDLAMAAAEGGMDRVAELSSLREQLERNPGNRERLLAQDPDAFIAKLMDWGWAFFPQGGSPVPGIALSDFAAIDVPVTILRSSAKDIHHPRAVSEQVHALIPGAWIDEPPWGEDEWPDRLRGFANGESAAVNWPLLAPQIAAFARDERGKPVMGE